jgi:competence protein ComEC
MRIAILLLGGMLSAAAMAASGKPLQIVAIDVEGGADLIAKFPVGTVMDHGENREMPPPGAAQDMQAMQSQALYKGYLSAIEGHPHRSLQPGDTVKIGSLTLATLTSDRQVPGKPVAGAKAQPACTDMPDRERDGGEENAHSVGVQLTYGKARIVALGDLTWNVEKALVCPTSRVEHADLFFVSHHGSNYSNSPALLNAVAPRVALMANGARKGGDRESHDTVSKSRGLQGFFALHYAENGGPEHNPDEAHIVNPDARNDQHLSLLVSVFTDGTVQVTNERTAKVWTYSR